MKLTKLRCNVLILCAFVFLAFSAPPKKVLIIGDSISIGYFPHVKKALEGEAEVFHNPGNAQHTGTGLRLIDTWLGEGEYDVILFNWGLWDLCYRHPESTVQGQRDKLTGEVTFTVDRYEENLTQLVKRLKQTEAKLMFVMTTVVPPGEPGRFEGDEETYNEAAKAIMEKYGVEVLDLHTPSVTIHQAYKKGVGNVHYTREGSQKLAGYVTEGVRRLLTY